MNETAVCTRCKRERELRYLAKHKNYSGKLVMRCTARSVCSSIARRNKEKRENVSKG